jgi:hypothetical protein
MQQDGFTIREVSHNFTITPSATDDSTKGFAIDSRWILDNGDIYVCTDATEDSAIWELQVTDVQDLQNVTDIGNATTNPILIPELQLYDSATDAYAKISYSDGQFDFRDINGRFIKVIEKDGLEQTLNQNDFTLTKEISSLTANRTRTEPNKDGTYAMLDDIPTGALANLDEVGTNEIENHAVTNNKLANMNANTVKGRLSGNGTPQDIAMANLPISTATQTALNLKQNSLGYIPLPTNAGTATGATLSFVTDRIYGTIASPVTGNITADVTGAQLGVTNIIIHNSGTAPTFSSEYKKLSGSGNYIVSVVNYIYCTFITSTEIIYSINQRT